MDWIKKRYDQFLLALAALLLLAFSVLIFLKTKSFSDQFAEAQTNVIPSDKIPELDISKLQAAQKLATDPAKWRPKTGTNEFFFVPEQYVIENERPKKPGEGARYADSITGTPGVPNIPNVFFTKNKLPLLDPGVSRQDPDKDGFTNEDEWRGDRDPKDVAKWSGSTDPNDPQSHPKYVTKLFLKQWIRVPFLLRFDGDDGDPAKPAEMTFQINTISRGKRTEFKKLGETIPGSVPGSMFKLEKFERKMKVNPSTGAEDDVSELTLVNTESGDPVVLVKGRQTDSPDSYALFDYQWNNKPIQVKKLQEFRLLPEADKPYKLIDINEAGAVIRLPDGVEYLVVPDPRAKR